jgi:potassium-dependent mechanosensitive channel
MKRLFLFLVAFSVLTASAGANEAAAEPPMPDPVDLRVGWWRYFSEGDDIDNRIDQMVQKLEEIKAGVQDRVQLTTQIERLILLLKNLQAEKQEAVEYKEVQPLFLSVYHLSDWLKVAERIREIDRRRAQIEREQTLIQANIDLLRQDLDFLQVQYRVLPESTAEKLIGGLEIMKTRVRLELLELRQNGNRQLLAHLAKNLEKLSQEKQFAEARLDLSNLKPEDLSQKADQAELTVRQAEEKLLKVEQQRFDHPEKVSWPDIIFARTLVLKAEMQHLYYQIVFDWAASIKKDEPIPNLPDKMMQWNHELESAKAKIREWRDIIRAEGDKIGEAPLEQENENDFEKDFLQRAALLQDARSSLNEADSIVADIELILGKIRGLAVEQAHYVEQIFIMVWNGIMYVVAPVFNFLGYTLFRVNEYPVTPWVLLRSILIVILAAAIGKILRRTIKTQPKLTKKVGPANLYIISRLIYYIFIILGLAIAFVSIGFDATNFVIIAGALGIGIGLGLQSLVNNFVSGLLLLFEKSIRVGDIIALEDGQTGTVSSISIRSSRIRSFNGHDIIVPNSELVSKNIVNWTMKDSYLRYNIPFGVSYGTDKENVRKVVLEAIKGLPYVIDDGTTCPKPQIWMTELGDNSINFELVVWVDFDISKSHGNMNSAFLWIIETALTKNGIEIPFPQRDIYVKQFPKP